MASRLIGETLHVFQMRESCSHDVSEESVPIEGLSTILALPLPSLDGNRGDLT